MSRSPAPTIPDEPPPPTLIDTSQVPPATGDEGDPRPAPPPAELTGRFGELHLLSDTHEARVYRTTLDGEPVVLKIYHRPSRDRAEVYAALREVTSPYVVRPTEAAPDASPPYEVSEFVPGGDLRRLTARHGGRLPAPVVLAIARQCAEALNDLHRNLVKHRDIKPDNILVRQADPVVIALADFGVARGGDRLPGTGVASVRLASHRSGTVPYMSPQAVAGLVSTDDDWWSLGITLAELALGRHPVGSDAADPAHPDRRPPRIGDSAYVDHLVRHAPIRLTAITDPLLRVLCQGLLRYDSERRWKYREVTACLDGDPPPLEPDPAGEAGVRPLMFHGHPCRTPRELAIVLSLSWDAAVAWVGQHDEELTEWLGLFPGAGRPAPEHRHPDPDVALLHLLVALNPSGQLRYRGFEMTADHLPVICRRAVKGFGDYERVVADLWRHRLLPVLARGHGGGGLDVADETWRHLDARWRSLRSRLRGSGAPVERLGPEVMRAETLRLACERDRHAELRRLLAPDLRDLARTRVPVPWFTSLRADTDPVEALAAHLLAEAALEYAYKRLEQWRAYLADRRTDALNDWLDRTQRSTALGWAAVAVGVPAVAWVVALTVSDLIGMASTAALAQSWLWAALCVLVIAATEIPFATWVGRDYHPAHSLAADIIGVLGRLARPVRGRRLASLAVVVAAALVLGAALSLLPVVLPAAAIAAHLVWFVIRVRRRPDRSRSAGHTGERSTA
ncbi:hypothetical protein GCM10009677_02100 [Sphaerisporangium rubeum]|uniref:Serine/threonine protein kinase n=1 Tax=Sphaerisporangium rubeum TaxID=321317 RepID=A0A7X0IDJ1_9ACTN|nr:serine/threonine protein kinase [Sphaerisporangium rubeum]